MRYLAVSITVFVLSGLVAPTLALGQQAAPKPKLTATPGSAFPDRTYILQLPPRAATPKLVLTENGGPVVGLAISATGGSGNGTYLIRYRSVLPPERKAVVRATITGFPAATTTYTTPALDVTVSRFTRHDPQEGETRWAMIVIVALFGLMAFALVTRLKHRD